MNNSQGAFAHSKLKQIQNLIKRNVFREFLFEDIVSRGTFLFKEMKLELYPDGKWTFYITAEGKSTTTILKNGRKSGPLVFVGFKDANGMLIHEEGVGQVNYGNRNEIADNYVCKGIIKNTELVESIEIRYEAWIDFACRRN